MLAAVPIANQPWGAKGTHCAPRMVGSANAIAIASTTTRSDDSISCSGADMRRPSALLAKTTPKIASATTIATPEDAPVRSAT